MEYDIFISYRREGGYDTAKHLNDLLVRDGYKVSFDIDTLRSGDFDTQLLSRIDQCKDFILIVDQHAFDRTLDPSFNPKNDWLRCELAYALKRNKNIIPIFLSGATGFPANLPSDLAGVAKKNGPEYNRYHFNAFYEDLKKRFLKSKSINYVKLVLYFVITIIAFYFIIVKIFSGTIKQETVSIENGSIRNEIVDTQLNEEFHEESTPKLSERTHLDNKLTKEEAIALFCGTFQYAETLSVIWDLELNPISKKIPLHMELLNGEETEDIQYAMGWFGTYFKEPQYWEVTSFNLGRDNNTALLEMILRYEDRWGREDDRSGILVSCKIKLELDDFNNLKISYVSGNDIPWIIPENGTITFTRQ